MAVTPGSDPTPDPVPSSDEADGGDELGPEATTTAPLPPVSRARVAAGIVFVAIGVIAAVLAVRAATEDTPAARSTSTADGSTTTTASSGDSTVTTTPPAGWPPAVQGRPIKLGPEGTPPGDPGDLAPGWYLWSDFHNWHLWLVGGEGSDSSATVTTSDALTITATHGEAGVEASPTSATVRRGDGDASIVGIDFGPGFYAKELTVNLTGDLPLRTGQSGADAANPLVVRFEPQG